MVNEFGFELDDIRAIEPVGFLEFLQMEANARLALTDSGGVQEAACILGIPCVTLRDNTECPETIKVKSNILAGANSEKILESTKTMVNVETGWVNPFGDGKSSIRVLDVIGS